MATPRASAARPFWRLRIQPSMRCRCTGWCQPPPPVMTRHTSRHPNLGAASMRPKVRVAWTSRAGVGVGRIPRDPAVGYQGRLTLDTINPCLTSRLTSSNTQISRGSTQSASTYSIVTETCNGKPPCMRRGPPEGTGGCHGGPDSVPSRRGHENSGTGMRWMRWRARYTLL